MGNLTTNTSVSSAAARKPTDWTFASQAKDGTPICIRPLRPDDCEREIAFLDSLSEESRYLRLLAPLKVLPPHLVDQLMDVNGRTSMAFVATIGNGVSERFIGIARYGMTDRPQVAEFGIAVTDNWQRQGVATRLIRILIRYARTQSINKLSGFVLPDNIRMLALATKLKFILHLGEDGLVHIEREIGAPPGGSCDS